MGNLLRANFLRLGKSKLFWGTLVFVAGYALWRIFTWGYAATIDAILFYYCVVTGLLSAVFSSLFLGTEYSDGTLRNKLVVGHTRFAIYIANLLTNIAVALLQCVIYLAIVLSLGSVVIGPSNQEMGRLLLLILGSLVTVVALCAIFTAVGMLCSRKAVTAVICIVGSFALFGVMSNIDNYLNTPKYSVHIDEQGMATMVKIPDDGSVSETMRVFYQFLDDALPFGQVAQYMGNRTGAEQDVSELLSANDLQIYKRSVRPKMDPLPLMAYSLAVTALTTGAGVLLFRRKDLK